MRQLWLNAHSVFSESVTLKSTLNYSNTFFSVFLLITPQLARD